MSDTETAPQGQSDPAQIAVPVAATTQPQPSPVPSRVPVKALDFWQLLVIGMVATLPLLAFGGLLYLQGFLSFPEVSTSTLRGDEARYFQDALDYREKRLTLSLILRTFITSFAFIVGLALCTQGGIFILRQVTAFSTVSANLGAFALPEDAAKLNGKVPLFSFASYSPGVMFLLGGVALMVATQYLAIPVRSMEIVPPSAIQLCLNDENEWQNCLGFKTAETSPPAQVQAKIFDICRSKNPPPDCQPEGK